MALSEGSAGGRSLRDLLHRDAIVVPLDASDLQGAITTLWAASEGGARTTRTTGPPEALRGVRPSELVPLGEHAVLAYLRDEAIPQVRVAMGIAREPLPFVPGTAREARILVLLLVPSAWSHLRILSGLGRLLRRSEVAERLAAARTAEEVLSLPVLGEPLVEEELRVRDVMSPGVASVGPDTPLAEVATLMVRRGLRAVPVVSEAGEVVGMITDREIMEYFLPSLAAGGEESDEAGETPVRDRMVRSVMCVREDQSLRDAATLMIQKDVDRFPVVSEAALVGFLTRGDIIRRLLAPRPGRGEAYSEPQADGDEHEGKGYEGKGG